MRGGQQDDPGSVAALCMVHWTRYAESGNLDDLAIALRICEQVRASDTTTSGLPRELTTALDWVTSAVAGEVLDASFDEEQRNGWAALMFSLGGIWWADVEGDPPALDRVIGAVSLAAGILGDEDPRLVRVLGFLGSALTQRGARDKRVGDFEAALQALDDALRRTLPGDEEYGQLLDFRVRAFLELHDLEPTPQHLTGLAQAILDALGELDPDDPAAQNLADLGQAFAANPMEPGYTPDQILIHSRLLLAVCPPGDPRRIAAMYFAAAALHDQAGIESSLPDNAEAISVARELMAILDGGQPDLRASALSLLFLCLLQRFEQAGDTAALLEAIDLARSAFTLPLADPALQAHRLVDLGVGLMAQHRVTGDRRSLDEAIRTLEEASSIPETSEQAARSASLLGVAYFTRFRLDGSGEDLDRAVEHCHTAVRATPPDRPDYPEWAGNLSQALWLRHQQLGTQPDLEDAISLARKAVRATQPGHADRARHCQNLGSTLLALYRQTGAGADLDEAIAAFEEAAAAIQAGTFGSPLVESSLSAALKERFDLQGRAADLDAAVTLVRSAIEHLPEGSLDRPVALYGLNAVLLRRYLHTGSEADLDDAITAGRLAAAAAAPDSGDATFAQSNLSYALQSRFRLTGQRPDIDEAVALIRALDVPTVSADLRPSVHANLAGALSERFQALSEPSDLDDAITEIRAALNAAGPSPRRIRYQAALGGLLDLRGRNRDMPQDVAEAITLLHAAVSATGVGQPERGDRVLGLARVLLSRHHRTGSAEDRAEALLLAREAAHIDVASADTRMTGARLWAELATDLDGSPAGLEGWRYAMHLLPLIAWPGISRKDQERQLTEVFGLASYAAASAITGGQPELAVEFLEHGRGLLWTQIVEARSGFSQLADTHPGHAKRLAEVRAALDVHLNADLGAALRPADTDRSQLAREWSMLLDEVRALPGFNGFLRLPGFTDIAAAASEGPVVLVNVGDLRSDALIIDMDGVRVVPLPGLTQEDLAAHLNTLYASPSLTPARPSEVVAAHLMITQLLGWLWTAVVGPVANELGNVDRVWWCPTGHLALLPLHAAMDPETEECLADRFVSSYTPTLRALITARARLPVARNDDKRVLLVAVPEAPGMAALNVQPEIDELASRFPGQLSILSGPAATRNNILAELPGHQYVHFACHASQNIGDPSASALLLHNASLTVLDMAGLQIPHGELAFLSACETAGGGAALPDESIHLAAALQAVGFRNVIATFWPVYDALAPIVAKAFYEGLAQDGTTANSGRLLHRAVRELRASALTPAVWAPYAHFGP